MKQVYLNTPAKQALISEASVIAIIAGRGWGKSDYVGAEMYDCMQKMPRSLGSLWGLTYNQILTKILPSAKKRLTSLGLKEDRPKSPGHYTIGRKPPDHFKRPYNEPLRWENVLCLFNGSAIEFISVDRPQTIAGGSYDYQIYDEAVYFPKDVHDAKAIPTLRGNVYYFKNCPKHGRRIYVSSQSWDPEGYWVEDQKYLRDDKTGELVLDEKEEPVLDPDFHFYTGSSFDNKHIITEKTLRLWRRTLPPVVWDIEIMAKRFEKITNSFYEQFNTKLHTYFRAYEYDYNYEKNEFGIFVKKKDADRDGNLPLKISFDFGTNFNSMLVSQYHSDIKELRFIREFWEANNQLIENLVKEFVNFYKDHKRKQVDLYGDPAGNKIQHMETISLFNKVAAYLRKHGWTVTNRMTGRAYPMHKVKHEFINGILSEEKPNLPKVRINFHACKYLLTSIKNAPMDKNQKKKKTSERQNIPQQTATHLSDAFDYQVYYFLYGKAKRATGGNPARLGRKAI